MYPKGVKRGSKLDPYMDYVQQRWESGCHNATQIWRELRQLGFDGSRGLLASWAANERPKLPLSSTTTPSPDRELPNDKSAPNKEAPPWSPSRASWLLSSQSATRHDR